MKAWQFDPDAKTLALETLPEPSARPGAVTVRVEAAMVLSYLGEVLEGARGETHPTRPFIPGTDAIGTVERVGDGVYHLEPGQRVSLQPHVLAREAVRNPAQILMGHTFRTGVASERLQSDWVDGAFAEIVEWPAGLATPIDTLGDLPAENALALSKLVVAYGGLLRVGLRPGETVAVNGASGFYGSGGVQVALAMGASRVVAVGRNRAALDEVCALDARATPCVLSGEETADAEALSAYGGFDVALDLVGAQSAQSTRTVLRCLNRGGRLAMMGSSAEPLEISFAEILMNDWLIAGQFMYPDTAIAELVSLAQAGLLDLNAVRPKTFPIDALHAAMQYGTTMSGLELTALIP